MSVSDSELADLLPLTPASFQVLLVLAERQAHGYAIMLEVERMTGGASRIGPGTLYRTIQRQLEEGLIEAAGSDSDERRVPYRLTRRGLAIAKAEAARLARLVGVARARGLLGAASGRSRRGVLA